MQPLPSLLARTPDHRTTYSMHSRCGPYFLSCKLHFACSLLRSTASPGASPPPTTSHRRAIASQPHAPLLAELCCRAPAYTCSVAYLGWAPGHHPLRWQARASPASLQVLPSNSAGSPPRSRSPFTIQTRQSSRPGRRLRQLRQGAKAEGQGSRARSATLMANVIGRGGEYLCVPSGRPLRCRQQRDSTRIAWAGLGWAGLLFTPTADNSRTGLRSLPVCP